jgi:hypothetical protein
MLIHHYNPATGEYLRSGQPDADPRNDDRWLIPAFATEDTPPPRTPTTWPFYRNGAWTLLPDFRGRLCFRMDTGEPVEIATAGRMPCDLGLTTEPRPSPRHSWIDGAWAVPRELIEREKHDAAMAEFSRLMAQARRHTAGKADAYAVGLLDEEQVYTFKAWSAYQMALVSAIEEDSFPDAVDWPPTPGPYIPIPASEVSADEANERIEQEKEAPGLGADPA